MKRREFLRSSLLTAAASAAAMRPSWSAIGPQTADVPAVTGDGREVVLKAGDLRDLAAKLQGELLLPGDAGYDSARLLLNPSFDKHPALVARPASVADVQAVVVFARANNLLTAVKCGGHSAAGQSSCDRGLQIDLSMLREVKVDAAARRASVAGGTLLKPVDHECLAQGLVTPLGTVSHTGVGGLTLGGGLGRLARRHGLAIDNLESVDVVCADGKLRHASAGENRDLFWGVRGGGGNFGIATNFVFKLHPAQRAVVSGTLSFPISRARDVLNLYAEYAHTAPDELYMDPVLVLPARGGPGTVWIEVCYSGPEKDAERALAPLRKLGTPAKDTLKTMDYELAQTQNDTGEARVIGSYLKSGFISEMPGKLVSAIVDNLPGDPGRTTVLFFQHSGGAAGRIAEGDTAFAQRYAVANMMAVTAWRQGTADPAPHMEAARSYWKTLEPFTRGFYVNDLAREVTASEINSNFRGNYARMVKLKNTYDPTNLFRLNANVAPGRA